MNSKLTHEETKLIRGIPIHNIIGIPNTGRRISIRCPFHNEHTPSFVLYPDNSFHCFGCNSNGQGAIDFVMKLGFTFPQACNELIKYI